MKTKRLLSAFMAVTMMLTTIVAFGTVSYAAEVTADTPIVSVELVAGEDISVSEGQYGYYLIAKLSNYGELSARDEDYVGRRLTAWQISLTFEEGILSALGTAKQASTDIVAKPSIGINDGVEATFAFGPTNADGYHPYNAGKVSDELLLVKIPVKTTATSFTVAVKGVVEISDVNADGIVLEGCNTKYSTFVDTEEALNIPATLTVGKTPDPVTPSISTAEPTATEAGIAVERADGTKFTYDNCYTVTVSMTNANDATKAGMQFIPKKVYENANNTWAGYAEVEFAADGLGAGERAYTAALINIPRKLAGQNIDMMARGFMVVNGETLTGTVVESVVNYEVTPEPGQN